MPVCLVLLWPQVDLTRANSKTAHAKYRKISLSGFHVAFAPQRSVCSCLFARSSFDCRCCQVLPIQDAIHFQSFVDPTLISHAWQTRDDCVGLLGTKAWIARDFTTLFKYRHLQLPHADCPKCVNPLTHTNTVIMATRVKRQPVFSLSSKSFDLAEISSHLHVLLHTKPEFQSSASS
jgi:hypothetical protein